jgi:hypothetical protein
LLEPGRREKMSKKPKIDHEYHAGKDKMTITIHNLESSGVEASDWRPRHDEQYHEV